MRVGMKFSLDVEREDQVSVKDKVKGKAGMRSRLWLRSRTR